MRTLSKAVGLIVLGASSYPLAAASVFADFNGDGIRDPSFSLGVGGSVTVGIYADVDNAHDGLTSYGVLAALSAAGIIEIDGATAPLKLANVKSDLQWDSPDNKTLSGNNTDVFDSSLVNAPSGSSVHLFDVVYHALAPGLVTLALGESTPGNPAFDGFVGLDGHAYDSEITFQSSQITVVPIPTLLIPFGLGLCGLLKRRVRS